MSGNKARRLGVVLAVALAVTVLPTVSAVVPPSAPGASVADAQPAPTTCQYFSSINKTACNYATLGWGTWSYADTYYKVSPDYGQRTLVTEFTTDDPIDVGRVPVQSGVDSNAARTYQDSAGTWWYRPANVSWREDTYLGYTLSRGWLVDTSTRYVTLADGSPYWWFDFLEEWGGAGDYLANYVPDPPEFTAIPRRHSGLFAGATDSPDDDVPYTCQFARWCFYGHAPPQPPGAFLGHVEYWPYTTVERQLRFTKCTTCVVVDPNPVVETTLGGWQYGRTNLPDPQPVTVKVPPLQCKQGSTVTFAPCGQAPPKNTTSLTTPLSGTYGPFVRNVRIDYKLVPPPGYTAGSNPQVDSYQVVKPFPTSIPTPSPGSSVTATEQLRFFKTTPPDQKFFVYANVEMDLYYVDWSFSGVPGSAVTKIERNAKEPYVPKMTMDGFRQKMQNGKMTPYFTVVGGNLD